MTIEAGWYSHLTTDTDVAALVGTRIYPHALPQSTTYPAIAYTRISTDHQHTMAGSAGFARARIQTTCWAETYTAAKTLADKVRLAADGFSGAMGSTTIQGCLLVDEGDMPIEREPEHGKTYYGVRMDFEIWFVESQPT